MKYVPLGSLSIEFEAAVAVAAMPRYVKKEIMTVDNYIVKYQYPKDTRQVCNACIIIQPRPLCTPFAPCNALSKNKHKAS